MKHMIRYFGLLTLGRFFLLGCQKGELQPDSLFLLPDVPEKNTIELAPAFDAEILPGNRDRPDEAQDARRTYTYPFK